MIMNLKRKKSLLLLLSLTLAGVLLVAAGESLAQSYAGADTVQYRGMVKFLSPKNRLDLPAQIRFFEATNSAGNEYVGWRAPFNMSASYTLIWPTVAPTTGQILQAASSDSVVWGSAGAGDITGVVAGVGLADGGLSGDVTLNVIYAATAGNADTLTLHDFVTGTPSANTFIKWNGANWVTAAAGGTIIGREVDGSPSIAALSTLEFLQSTGLKFTDQGSNVGRVEIDTSTVWINTKTEIAAQIASAISAYQQDSDTTGFDASKTWVLNKNYLTSETGDISAVVAGDGLIGGATTGSATVDVNPKRSGYGRMIVTSDSLLVDLNAIDSTRVDNGQITSLDIKDAGINTGDLANSAVTGAKIAANTITGDKIALGSDAQGDVMYYNGTDWVRLGAGTTGQVLHTQGAGANPIWDTDDGAGGGAPIDATYITQTANGSLTQEQALGALATGMMASTTTTGVVATRILTGTAGAVLITNGDGSGNPTFTLPSTITVPSSYVTGGDPADAGAFRLSNAENIAWEASPAATDLTLGVDASEILQSSANFNAPALTENSNAVPNATDHLGFFAATTSAQFFGVISDETGSGVVVGGTSPTFTTNIIVPTVIGGTGTTSDLFLQTTSGIGASGADMHFLVGNNGTTEAMTILNNGKVGIGTASPSVPLVVSGSANLPGDNSIYRTSLQLVENYAGPYFGLNITNNATTGNDSQAGIEFSAYNGSSVVPIGWVGVTAKSFNAAPYPNATYLENFGSGGIRILADDPTDGLIAFYTGGYLNDSYRRMTITPAGNVGIGTMNPNQLFSVGNNFTVSLSGAISIGGQGQVMPVMTSNSAPAPYSVSASSTFGSSFDAWKCFDGKASTYWNTSNGNSTGWLKIDMGSAVIISQYQIQSIATESGNNYAPKSWVFEGSTTGAFTGEQTTLDTQANVAVWNNSETRTYILASSANYRYYRINVTANQGNAYLVVASFIPGNLINKFLVDSSGNVLISNTGLHLFDTDTSHNLIIAPGSNLTADRVLTVTTGDAARTLTMTGDATVSGTNTGDVTVTGESYLSLSSQQITANAVNLSGTHVTGTLAAARFPALTGDVTTTAGSVATAIGADKVTEAMLKAVNAAVDEDIFTYEATTGDFEWHTLAELNIQPLEATLTDIADGTIDENLVNTANPWAVNEGGTGAATFTANGVLYGNTTSALQVTAQGGANTVLTANAGAPSFSGQPTLATGIITKGQNAVEVDPYSASAGNTGEVRFLELAATGTNYVGWKAHDALAATTVYTMPRKGSATTGMVLHYATTGDSTYWDTDDGAGGGAPTNAQYLTLALNGSLSDERVAVGATNNISLNDGGANGNLTIGLAATLDFAAKVVINDTLLVAEGATANGFETHFTIDDPTADREINWPDADGEVTVLGNSSTGTGGVVREDSPTITTPTIADLTNMNHIHQGVTSGGYFVGNSFIRLQNNTDAASNQVAQFQSGDRATAADDDEGYLSFYNDNDGGTQTEFSRFSWLATDVTAATKDAAFTFDIMSANSLTEVLRIQSSAAGTITVNVPNGTLQQGGTAVTLQDRTLTVAGTSNEITSSAGAQDLSANRTWTLSLPATIDLGGKTSFEIPNAAAPTTDAFGEIAGDDNAYTTGRGAAQFYDGTTSTWLVGFPTTETKTDGYIPKYIAATGRWRLAPDSTTAGGGTAWDAIAAAAGLGSISFAGFDQDITSAEDGGDILTITNSDADRASDSNILVLADNDGGDANAFYLRMIGDADGTPTNDYLFSQTSFSVGAGIAATFASAASLTVPSAGGSAPTADGDLRYDTTQDKYVGGGAGALTGSFPRVLAVGHPAESLTNSTASDQDYTSIFTIPANYLIENRVIRVTLGFEYVTGSSTVTISNYLKLGSTKVFTNTAADLPNTVTRSGTFSFVIHGTAAAGASVNVETMAQSGVTLNLNNAAQANALNNTDQPVALATNGTLAITPGVTYSGTGSTETFVLRTFIVEELN